MLSAVTLSFALLAPAAPLPKPAPAAAPGLPPQVIELKPDTTGKIRVTVVRPVVSKVAAGNGRQIQEREITVRRATQVELADVKDLKVYTADGKEVSVKDALKKLADGGPVVVAADGKPVSPTFLKLFRDDVLVLVSPELGPQTGRSTGGVISGPIQVLPAQPVPLPAPAPGGVGVIEVEAVPLPGQAVPPIKVAPRILKPAPQPLPAQPAD